MHNEEILTRVQTPGQYVGGEPNAIIKTDAEHKIALCFPDTYGIGMSNHGLRVLYEILNKVDNWACERAFAPYPDMEKELRDNNIALNTLETATQLSSCDLISFSMQYELSASGMLTMLDLGGIELEREKRDENAPLIIAGGHSVFNPEPLVDFVDLFFIGEGEEEMPRLLELLGKIKDQPRAEVIKRIANEIPGIYAPALYETEECGGFTVVKKSGSAPFPVKRQIVQDFSSLPSPTKPVVPIVEAVHERVVLEIMRGCPNGCRFCQAGMACRPVRWRKPQNLLEEAKTCYRNTGYDEIGLLSLSTSDYPEFDNLVEILDEEFAPEGVSLSLPSLRVNHTLTGIPKKFKTVRKSGLTIAPEAGTDRLRMAINKDVTNEDLIQACESAFIQGWNTIKLYFMIGLPTETDEDVEQIAHLANTVARLRGKNGKGGKGHAITASVSNYIPKPFTPFEREKMDSPEDLCRKHRIIYDTVNPKWVNFKGHEVEVSFLEGVLSRGDRKLGKVILAAWRNGARLEGWSDYFNYKYWEEAFKAAGIDPEFYACAQRAPDATLPWSHIDSGLSDEFFKRELAKSKSGKMTHRCDKDNCAGCGVTGCLYLQDNK